MSLKKSREQLDPIIDRGRAGTRRFLKRSLVRWERHRLRALTEFGDRMYRWYSS